MKESRKDFIKKAHKNACSEWKTNIEKEFPKLFKEDEKLNGWYKDKEQKKWCVFLEDGIIIYGFDSSGDWFEDHNYTYELQEDDYKATDKEVDQAIIKEAKKKGFKEGVYFKSKWISDTAMLFDGEFCFDKRLELCYKNDGGVLYTLFENGVWAEIIETITKEQAEKELGKTILN